MQANATWSPDGKYLVFARGEATNPRPPGRPLATFADDPNEIPMRYDLYRVPFDGGRGGVATPVAGASGNGMSNSFPKISPDGRWIVYVQARNGLLMRPDSRLYIVPAGGGEARFCFTLPASTQAESLIAWEKNGTPWVVRAAQVIDIAPAHADTKRADAYGALPRLAGLRPRFDAAAARVRPGAIRGPLWPPDRPLDRESLHARADPGS